MRTQKWLYLDAKSKKIEWSENFPEDSVCLREAWFEKDGSIFNWSAFRKKWPKGIRISDLVTEKEKKEYIEDYHAALHSSLLKKVFEYKDCLPRTNFNALRARAFDRQPFELSTAHFRDFDGEPYPIVCFGDRANIRVYPEEILILDEKREISAITRRIAEALAVNYDDITEHEEPYIFLGLSQYGLRMPERRPALYEEGLFVDELTADLSDIEGTIELAFSKDYENPQDGCYRVDTMELEDVDSELLSMICLIAENHRGEHLR